jgi:hypothetical protein
MDKAIDKAMDKAMDNTMDNTVKHIMDNSIWRIPYSRCMAFLGILSNFPI